MAVPKKKNFEIPPQYAASTPWTRIKEFGRMLTVWGVEIASPRLPILWLLPWPRNC